MSFQRANVLVNEERANTEEYLAESFKYVDWLVLEPASRCMPPIRAIRCLILGSLKAACGGWNIGTVGRSL